MDNPFDFRMRQVSGPLADCVESVWFARGTIAYTQEKIAPTGSCVAILILGDPIEQTPGGRSAEPVRSAIGLITGPQDSPITNRPLAETYAVGIVATPVGCARMFGLSPRTLRGRIEPLPDVWHEAGVLRRLLLDLEDPDAMLRAVESHLQRHLAPETRAFRTCLIATRRLAKRPEMHITELADELGLSHGHLDRLFGQIVGLGPRALANIFRMRALLQALDVMQDPDWPGLATQYGWFDQAHLIRSFRRYTGVTPGDYVHAQRAHFSPDEAQDGAGFVPETG